MTLKNNRAPLLSIIKLYASFYHQMWIQTGVTVRKPLRWVVTSVTLTFHLWPWPFAWTSLLSLVITPENFMMIRWLEHSQKGVTDRQTDWTIHRAAWSQLKILDKQVFTANYIKGKNISLTSNWQVYYIWTKCSEAFLSQNCLISQIIIVPVYVSMTPQPWLNQTLLLLPWADVDSHLVKLDGRYMAIAITINLFINHHSIHIETGPCLSRGFVLFVVSLYLQYLVEMQDMRCKLAGK